MGGVRVSVLLLAGVLLCGGAWGADVGVGEYDPRYGTYAGALTTLWHDVTGDVYAVDNVTIHIRSFNYDGEAPDAYFFAGNRTPKPSNKGFIIPNEKNDKEVLGPYRDKNLVLRFPVTKKGQRGFFDVKWISVWCERFAIDFGHVVLPEGLEVPHPSLGAGELESDSPLLSSGPVYHTDTNTVTLTQLTYDGSVDDAIFVIGSGDTKAAGVQVPDERGQKTPLRKYKRETLNLKLPKEARGKPVQYVGVWSPTHGLISSVTFPQNERLPPPVDSLA